MFPDTLHMLSVEEQSFSLFRIHFVFASLNLGPFGHCFGADDAIKVRVDHITF